MTGTREDIPTARGLMKATLEILRGSSGPVAVEEMEKTLADALSLSANARSRLHGKGTRTELGYRAAWARTFLREKGLIESAGHAKWRATDAGRHVDLESAIK